jgi:septal ring factor EnvC (AmiA/AmiB activator)
MKIFCLFLLVFIYTLTPAYTEKSSGKIEREIQKEKINLEDVKEKIKQQKKEIRKVTEKESRIISRLNEIEKQLLQEQNEQKLLNKKTKDIQAETRNTLNKIDDLKKLTSEKDVYLKKRLIAIYKYYRRSGLTILLSADSYDDLSKKEKYFGEIVGNDFKLFRECSDNLEKKRKFKNDLDNEMEELIRTKKNLLIKADTVKETHEKKLALLKKIKHEKNLQIKALNELEIYSKELQKFIETLPSEKEDHRFSNRKFSDMKGKLDFPVKGKILSGFGTHEYPDLHTYTFQKGIEIAASEGSKIKSIFEGKVVYSDWFKGYGYMIIIDHGDSYHSLSAHASKLLKNVGEFVSEGETVALVGDTNSIKGNCLYFEIRHHGKPTNPIKWLKKNGNQ